MLIGGRRERRRRRSGLLVVIVHVDRGIHGLSQLMSIHSGIIAFIGGIEALKSFIESRSVIYGRRYTIGPYGH